MFSRSINCAPLSPGESLFELQPASGLYNLELQVVTPFLPPPHPAPARAICQLVKSEPAAFIDRSNFHLHCRQFPLAARGFLSDFHRTSSKLPPGGTRMGGGRGGVLPRLICVIWLKVCVESIWKIGKPPTVKPHKNVGFLGDEKSVIVGLVYEFQQLNKPITPAADVLPLRVKADRLFILISCKAREY